MEHRELTPKNDDSQNLLMEAFIEKLEGMEILLHAALDERPAVDLSPILNEITSSKKEILASYSKLLLDSKILNEFNQNFKQLQHQLTGLSNAKIEYRHKLHKGIWISVGLALIVVVLASGWINTYRSLNQFRENDIKYRYLKARGNRSVVLLCRQTDSLYDKNEDGFINSVNSAEGTLMKIADSLRLAGDKRRSERH